MQITDNHIQYAPPMHEYINNNIKETFDNKQND